MIYILMNIRVKNIPLGKKLKIMIYIFIKKFAQRKISDVILHFAS